MIAPTIIDAANALEAYLSAEALSLAPRRRLMRLPAPTPRPKPRAWIMVIIENTAPTAADADLSICDTKYVSAVLYMTVINELATVGIDSEVINLGMGVSIIFLY